jgi:hypothetical protein
MNFKRMAQNPIEYQYGPRSVAIGDFNSDTWLDMVVVNSIVGKISIYLGDNNGAFPSPFEYSTGLNTAPHMVALGDFNNDLRLDIAVTNLGANSLNIFLGSGNESFVSQIEFSTGISRPVAIHLADFNNDTLLDIATANYGTDSVSIFYGYGNGTVSDSIMYSTGYDSFPYSLVAGDFNNDNYLDLAIANYGTNNVDVLFGNSNGTFANQIIFSTGFDSHPSSITCGHFNEDTFLDIAIVITGIHKVAVLLNNGNGTFANQMIYSIDAVSPYALGVGV